MTQASHVRLIQDPAGQWVSAVCLAIWHSSGPDHVRDSVCGRRVHDWLGDSPLCAHHLERAQSAARTYQQREQDRANEIARARYVEKMRYSVVYYVLCSYDARSVIKIGTTNVGVGNRLSALRRSHRADAVLACHRGEYQTEARLHQRFSAERIAKTEFFWPTPRLLAHVRHVAERWDQRPPTDELKMLNRHVRLPVEAHDWAQAPRLTESLLARVDNFAQRQFAPV